MIHPEIARLVAADHLDTLRRDARRPPRKTARPREDASLIELRLCRVGDHDALEELATLSERTLPAGSFVLAFVNGRLTAAHSLDGGGILTDPFAQTAHLRRLLAMRAAQIQQPVPTRFRLGRRRHVAA